MLFPWLVTACLLPAVLAHRSAPRLDLDADAEEIRPVVHASALEVAETAKSEVASGDLTCIERTGGTCAVDKCFEWRGPTQCSMAACYCSDGGCAGADGKCYQQRNELVASGFVLRNVARPSQVLYVPAMGKLLRVGEESGDAAKWKLFRLAGGSQFLLSSVRFPDTVAVLSDGQECSGGKEGRSCVDAVVARTVSATWPWQESVPTLALELVAAPQGSVMIKAYQSKLAGEFYMHSPEGATEILTKAGRPGLDGYWTPEPPFDFQLSA